MDGLKPGLKDRTAYLALLAIAAVAVMLRLYVLSRPSIALYDPDSGIYVQLAQGLRAGCGLRRLTGAGCAAPELLRTPGYPLFLALFRSPENALAMQSLLGGMLCLPLGIFALHRWGKAAGLCAAVLLAVDGPSILIAGMFLSDVLFALLVTLWMLLEIRALETVAPRRAAFFVAIGAFCLSGALLVRPVGLLLLPVAVAMPFLGPQRRLHQAAMALLAISLPALTVVAWTQRNATETGVGTYSVAGDINLYYYEAAGVVARQRGESFEAAQRQLERAVGVSAGAAGQDGPWSPPAAGEHLRRALHAAGQRIVLHHLGLASLVTLQNFVYVSLAPERSALARILGTAGAHHVGPADAVEPGVWRIAATLREMSASRLLTALVVLQLAITLAAWCGVIRCMRYWRSASRNERMILLSLLAGIIALLLPAAGPEATARYRVPAAPMLALMAGAGLFGERVGQRRSRATKSKPFGPA